MRSSNFIVVALIIAFCMAVVLIGLAIKKEVEQKPIWFKYTTTEEAREKTRECRRNGQNSVIIFRNGEYTIKCVNKSDE